MASPRPTSFTAPKPATAELLTLAHDPDYVASYLNGTIDARAMRRIGFPWDAAPGAAHLHGAGAARCWQPNWRWSMAWRAARPAAPTTPTTTLAPGYCIFNDLAVAARALCSSGAACSGC